MNRKARVVILGGGTSGFAAAYTLLKRQDGIEVVVLEAADRAGGRMAGDEVDGFYINTAASLFLDSYDTVRALAKDIGVPLVPSPNTKGGYIYRKGDSHAIKAGSSVKQRIQTTCIGLPHCARLN